MIRACAALALIVALAIVAVKTLLAEPLWWPFLIIEYANALTLALGAITVLRGGQSHLLVAGWAFTFGTTWSTFSITLPKDQALRRCSLSTLDSAYCCWRHLPASGSAFLLHA